MDYESAILQKEEGVATITLNRPEALNAWNHRLEEDSEAAIREVSEDREIRVLIITGAGRGFSSGYDVGLLAVIAEGRPILETAVGRFILGLPSVASVAFQIRNLDIPVIAAVNGPAYGAGFSIAIACDIRIASELARFSQAFIMRGLIPDTGSTYLLPRLVGIGRACELVFTGATIGAEEAERIGIVNRVVPHDELMNAAREMAARIAKMPPITVQRAKRALYQGAAETNLASQIEHEIYVQGLCMQTEDFKEGVRSFLEKREPEFKGR